MILAKKMVCIVCPLGCRLEVDMSGDKLNVSGNKCKRGLTYAEDELTNPVRMVCSTVKINGGVHSVIPVKTDKALPDKYKLEVVKALKAMVLQSPVKMGDVVIADIFGTGVNIVAERDM